MSFEKILQEWKFKEFNSKCIKFTILNHLAGRTFLHEIESRINGWVPNTGNHGELDPSKQACPPRTHYPFLLNWFLAISFLSSYLSDFRLSEVYELGNK